MANKQLTAGSPTFLVGVVITWALLGSVLSFFLRPPITAIHFVMLGIAGFAFAAYLVYLKRSGFDIAGKGIKSRQLLYYAALTTLGIGALIVLL